MLPEPDLASEGLDAGEWREALRACKGMMLRQEVYELDVDALEDGEQRPVKLFSTAYHNCHIHRLQPRGANQHAVFLVTESEAITYHYELDLRPETLTPDPRIAHTLNLRTDEYGNVLESVAIAYRRFGQHEDDTLPMGADALIARAQGEMHLAYTETRYTNDVNDAADPDNYRLRVPCEVLTYELSGIGHEDESDRESADPRDNRYFSLDELRRYRLSDVHQTEGLPVAEIAYHELPDRAPPQKRCVEQVRMLFFRDDLSGPRPFRQLGRLGLPYESYKLALTDDLLTAVLGDKLGDLQTSGESRQAMLDRVLGEGGYHRFADEPNRWWIRSGIAGFEDDAARHFYLPECYTDPFHQTTTLQYDEGYDLYLRSSIDPVGNRTEVTRFDFRVLAPSQMRDLNNNLSQVAFDILGMPAAMAVKGKGSEGDDLEHVPVDLDTATLIRFFTSDYDEDAAPALLGNATARHLYYFGEHQEADGRITYGHHPACAAGLLRETHVAQITADDVIRLQVGFEYSDGMGQVLMAKAKAEAGLVQFREGDRLVERSLPLRWITNGKTILNNKGKPVKQYEPYFSPHPHWNAEEASQEIGVTPVMYYDAAGRLIRTEMPDGSYSRVELSPWFMAAYDASDTILERGNVWRARYASGTPEERRAARLAERHAHTPAVTHLDSLGREVVAIAHNRYQDSDGLDHDENYLTYTKLDAEGKPLWIRDARGNRVMEYINRPGADTDYAPCYDIAGNLLFQHSMDAGDRWMLMDSTGQPCYAWDVNERIDESGAMLLENRTYHTRYDELRRPLEQRLRINGGDWQVTERFIYGEGQPGDQERNLRGQVFQHDDPSGRITNDSFDFKGNLLAVRRQLVSDHRASVIDWSGDLPAGGLAETFTQRTEYDALNRMTRLENWHLEGRAPAIYTLHYNQRGTLQSETVTLQGRTTEDTIRNIEYDAKGQRTFIEYGNGTTTRYHYDPLTFRLVQLRTTRPGTGGTLPSPPSTLSDPNVLQNLYYTYDPSGNIVEIRDDAYEPAFFQNQIIEPRSLYAYDALYRLIEATGRENGATAGAPSHIESRGVPSTFPVNSPGALRRYTQRYSYDPVGNIERMQHIAGSLGSWTRHYEYADDSNRLVCTWEGADRWDSDRATNKTEYRYDTHGSMLNLANVAPGQFLRWDTRDMIHSLDLVGGGWTYYNYDSGKQRTRKRVERNGSTVEERLYLGGTEWYRRWVGERLVEEIETHHLFVDDQRVLIVEDVLTTDNANLDVGTLIRYQYGNHLGSVGLELDGNAAVISYEEYHPYGTTAYRASNAAVRTTAKRYRYTAMERDEETGLSYHTARYYAPWLGRWGSADPKGIAADLQLLGYSRNPIQNTDRYGKQEQSAVGPVEDDEFMQMAVKRKRV